MEILYRVDKMTFKDREQAEKYERELKVSLVTRKIAYKRFYLPLAFKHYKCSLEKLKTALKNLRIKTYTSMTVLCTAHEEWLAKKRILRERMEEYRNIKALIKQLSTVE